MRELITRSHYERMMHVLLRGMSASTHKEAGKSVWTWVYIPNEGVTNDDQRYLIKELGNVRGLYHRGGLVDYDSPDTCRAKVRTTTAPGWRVCGINSRSLVEKMIDVSLATDLVRFACKNEYDVAFLVTEDRDLIPAVRAAQQEGKEIIHTFIKTSAITGECRGGFRDIISIFRRVAV